MTKKSIINNDIKRIILVRRKGIFYLKLDIVLLITHVCNYVDGANKMLPMFPNNLKENILNYRMFVETKTLFNLIP